MIYHITTSGAWDEAHAAGIYTPESLSSEGFVHCSTAAQLLSTANRYYRSAADLIVLQISPPGLTADLVYEDTTNCGEPHPHLYGPLNLDAVVAVVPLEESAAGFDRWPFSAPAR